MKRIGTPIQQIDGNSETHQIRNLHNFTEICTPKPNVTKRDYQALQQLKRNDPEY